MEKDFYKFLNNNNFGIDCRNNIDSCNLEPIYDDIGEISYIKQHCLNILCDKNYRQFFSPEFLIEEINNTFDNKIFALNKNDPTYKARLKYFERQRDE